MAKLSELDALFDDPANRRWGVFYHCPADPRLIAPSRPRWHGYRINFAHPYALQLLLLYLLVLLAPLSLAAMFGPRDLGQLAVLAGVLFAICVSGLIGLSAWLSRRHGT